MKVFTPFGPGLQSVMHTVKHAYGMGYSPYLCNIDCKCHDCLQKNGIGGGYKQPSSEVGED